MNATPQKEQMNIEEQYIKELKDFYSAHFPTPNDLNDFIHRAFQFDLDNRKPRRMLFQVQRFVTLATEIDKIRPARDGLRVLFFKCCMESLARLSEMENDQFCENFATCFSSEGKKHILDNFTLSYIEDPSNKMLQFEKHKLVIDDILEIIRAMRNMVVHEGNYWELQLFASDDDSTWLTCLETDKRLLTKSTYTNTTNHAVTYCFSTSLQYENFSHYFVEACITFINRYMESVSNEE